VSLKHEIEARLEEVAFPSFRHSIVRYGLVEDVRTEGGSVTVVLRPVSRRREVTEQIAARIRAVLSTISAVRSIEIAGAAPAHAGGHGHAHPSPGQGQIAIPGVSHIVAVSSAKGGVGKSTVAVNLAIALQRGGSRVALMDSDVYGPSVPLMMGLDARPRSAGDKISPIERYGVDVMSMGFFLDDSSPVIWRGPMVMGLVRQFLRDVDWGVQDYLIVDMPPGTGDAALTLAQQVPLSGAVIVTTPQEVALADVERGIAMFRQLQVPLLGIVENMSYYVCPECGEPDEVFGSGGGEALARRFGVPLIAKLPLVPDVREGGDEGRPITVTSPDHQVSKQFDMLAKSIEQTLASRGR
jgi:ATP-binding protein involved in chromosome partitioning